MNQLVNQLVNNSINNPINNPINQILQFVSMNFPDILFVISILLLYVYKSFNYLTIYFVGYVIQILVVLVLKSICKQPRPSENLKHFYALINTQKFINPNRFGFPSGHSARALYSTVFIWFALKNYKITTCYVILSLLIMYQRIKMNYHTVIQVLTGALLGACIGYYFYCVAYKKIQGPIKMKKDDNAPKENGLV
jgi:membrane-associated phospholipid phosphatase